MKKILALLLAILMLAGCLAGCSEKTDNTDTANNTAADNGETQTDPDSDWDYIQNKGELVVGITYFAPMNYEDENGELIGFETEFAKAVAEKLGVAVKFQEIDWNSKEIELNAKNIDCIWKGMTITDERKENMEITIPYMQNKQVMVVKAENAEKYTDALSMNGAVLVAESGSAGESVAQDDVVFSGTNYTAVPSQADVLMEVFSGTADIGLIDYVMSIGSIGEGTDYADLVVVDAMEFSPEEYGVAFRKGSDVAAKVNAAMITLASDGTLDAIASTYKLNDLLIVK